MPFCTQCGTGVEDTDQFCAACGGAQRGGGTAGRGNAAAAGSAPGSGAGTTGGSGASGGGPGAAFKGILDDMSPRKASLLCYIPVVGWIPSIVMLSSARFQHDRQVRFHAFQGLYLFVAWLLADWVVGPMFRHVDFHVEGLLKAAVMCAWIFMMVKTSHNEDYRLPIFGELAERSANEQR